MQFRNCGLNVPAILVSRDDVRLMMNNNPSRVGFDERYGCRPEAQRSVADPEIAAKTMQQDLGRRKAFLEKRVNIPVTPGGAEKNSRLQRQSLAGRILAWTGDEEIARLHSEAACGRKPQRPSWEGPPACNGGVRGVRVLNEKCWRVLRVQCTAVESKHTLKSKKKSRL